MRELAINEMNFVSGNGVVGDSATIGAGAATTGAILVGETSTIVLAGAAGLGAAAGVAFGVGWLIGTAIYNAVSE